MDQYSSNYRHLEEESCAWNTALLVIVRKEDLVVAVDVGKL